MSLERHRQKEQRHHEALRVDLITPTIDWDLFIHDVTPPYLEIARRDYVFGKQVAYQPSRVSYSPRGVNGLEELEMDCE